VSGRVVVLCSVGSMSDAERIAGEVVGRGLAACVNIVPGLTSIYRWKGAIERDQELLLLIKTRSERFEELRQAIVSLHPYEVPEVVALAIESGHQPYLDWLDGSLAR
jgi:periplasmic divalent cation tolerance protein